MIWSAKFLKGCLSQILLGPFLNTLAHVLRMPCDSLSKNFKSTLGPSMDNYIILDESKVAMNLLKCSIKLVCAACPKKCAVCAVCPKKALFSLLYQYCPNIELSYLRQIFVWYHISSPKKLLQGDRIEKLSLLNGYFEIRN